MIDLAEKLNAENYTAESYAKLTAALQQQKKSAMQKMQPWKNKCTDQCNLGCNKGLESADKAANEDLKKSAGRKDKSSWKIKRENWQQQQKM